MIEKESTVWNLFHAINTGFYLHVSNHLIYVYIGPAGCIGLSGVLVWECGECPNQYRLVKEPLGPDSTKRRPTGGGQYTERAGRLGPTGPAPSQEEEDGASGMALKWKLVI